MRSRLRLASVDERTVKSRRGQWIARIAPPATRCGPTRRIGRTRRHSRLLDVLDEQSVPGQLPSNGPRGPVSVRVARRIVEASSDRSIWETIGRVTGRGRGRASSPQAGRGEYDRPRGRRSTGSGMIRLMAEELLERVPREIRERKQTAQAAYEESRRLERALAALAPASGSAARAGEGASPRRRARSRRQRAAAGANRLAFHAARCSTPPAPAPGDRVATTSIRASESARSRPTTTLARARVVPARGREVNADEAS
jgi:hypothetical protein